MRSVKILINIVYWCNGLLAIFGLSTLVMAWMSIHSPDPAPTPVWYIASVASVIGLSFVTLAAMAREQLNSFLGTYEKLRKNYFEVLDWLQESNKKLFDAERKATSYKWLLDATRGSSQEDLDAVADHKYWDPDKYKPGLKNSDFSPLTDPGYFSEESIKWAKWISGRCASRSG